MESRVNEHSILLVEDDPSLSQWISEYLQDQGYRVATIARGDLAVSGIRQLNPDLLVLDLMLPVKDGYQVCREARRFYSRPILMITAFSEETDEVRGLELGADDYLRKPLRPQVLLARIRALLRRRDETAMARAQQLTFGPLSLDASCKSVRLGNDLLALSAKEFDVLWLLAAEAGKVVSREDLITRLRGIEYDGLDRSIDIRISRLRKKLHDDRQNPYKIKTVWGQGYLFAADAWSP